MGRPIDFGTGERRQAVERIDALLRELHPQLAPDSVETEQEAEDEEAAVGQPLLSGWVLVLCYLDEAGGEVIRNVPSPGLTPSQHTGMMHMALDDCP